MALMTKIWVHTGLDVETLRARLAVSIFEWDFRPLLDEDGEPYGLQRRFAKVLLDAAALLGPFDLEMAPAVMRLTWNTYWNVPTRELTLEVIAGLCGLGASEVSRYQQSLIFTWE